MRVTTWNVNGLRAALRKGVLAKVDELAPDVLLLQEVRSTPDQLPPEVVAPPGWYAVWHPAEKLGYAGTAIWSRAPIEVVARGMGEGDPHGRLLDVRTGGLRVVSVYLPSGSSSAEAQARKDAWMPPFGAWMQRLLGSGEPVVVGGDLNIAHTEADIWDPRGNKNTSGFLPHEREWFTELLGQGWVDTLRQAVGPVKGPYSWWSQRGQARVKDRGWRIDYLLTHPSLKVDGAHVVPHDQQAVSDHSPVSVDLRV